MIVAGHSENAGYRNEGLLRYRADVLMGQGVNTLNLKWLYVFLTRFAYLWN